MHAPFGGATCGCGTMPGAGVGGDGVETATGGGVAAGGGWGLTGDAAGGGGDGEPPEDGTCSPGPS